MDGQKEERLEGQEYARQGGIHGREEGRKEEWKVGVTATRYVEEGEK